MLSKSNNPADTLLHFWELPHDRKKLDMTFVMYGFPEVLVINNVISFISA